MLQARSVARRSVIAVVVLALRVHVKHSQERPSQAITRSRKVTTSWEKMRKRVSPFAAVARRGSPM